MKFNKQGIVSHSSALKWGSVLFVMVAFFVLMWFLNLPKQGEVATAASKVNFEKAHVIELISDTASEDVWTEGLRLGVQEVMLQIDSGKHKGESLYTVNYLSAYGNVDLRLGSKVIVRLDYDESGAPYITSISSHDRSGLLIGLTALFVLSLVIFGGKKGVAAIIGLLFTVLCIWYLLIPLIERGVPSIPSAILVVAVTTFVSLGALNGLTKKTMIAVIGCVGGVTIAGVIAYISGMVTPINGFNMPEAEELVLRASDSGMKLSGLLVSGVLIASLGAVMDVALTITSAIVELSELNPKLGANALFRSGINIGRDAMGTMANTLILAFAGASLNMLVLFRVFDYPYRQIFNSDLMTIEIVQGLAGSIGIVLTVPLVAALSATTYGYKKRGKTK